MNRLEGLAREVLGSSDHRRDSASAVLHSLGFEEGLALFRADTPVAERNARLIAEFKLSSFWLTDREIPLSEADRIKHTAKIEAIVAGASIGLADESTYAEIARLRSAPLIKLEESGERESSWRQEMLYESRY